MPLGPGGAQPAAEQRPGRAPTTSVLREGGPLDRPDPMRLRGFVPVDEPPLPAERQPRASRGRRRRSDGDPRDGSSVARRPHKPAEAPGSAIDDWEQRVSLFGEADA